MGYAKSRIVREAIHDYADRVGRPSEGERLRLLKVFDELVPGIPNRPVEEVDEELAQLRAALTPGSTTFGTASATTTDVPTLATVRGK